MFVRNNQSMASVPLQHFPVNTVLGLLFCFASSEACVEARPKTRHGNSDELVCLGKTKHVMEVEGLANQNELT